MSETATILLVDNHPTFLQGLNYLLAREKGLGVVGEAGDGLQAIDMVRRHEPDLVVMDISMPNLDGIEATRRILSEFPQTRVLALSVNSGGQYIREMLQAGASGYVLKESVPEELVRGIRSVLAGQHYLGSAVSEHVVVDYTRMLSEEAGRHGIPRDSILSTKLHPPPVSADIIPRSRLIAQLEEGRDRAMTMIAAPPGYGKSMLASQWLQASSCPVAWVSLDSTENDPREFLRYLLAAISEAFPGLALRSASLLTAPVMPPVATLARFLLNDTARVEERFILVLDDYHRISEEAVHQLMAELLKHPSPSLHLVMTTRRDPPLPLGRLRAYGQLAELTTEDLRFTIPETRAFLERFLRVDIGEETAAVLDQSLEGWVAGLRLAAHTLSREGERQRVIQTLIDESHQVRDYLVHEVLSSIPEACSRFMLLTSVVDRFCAPLCDSLAAAVPEAAGSEEPMTGRTFLDWLTASRLFVIPLDDRNQWFRYHHLFQKMLHLEFMASSSREEIAAARLLASQWFENEGLIDEAIRYALAGEAGDRAAQLVVRHKQDVLNADNWHILARWVSLLPDDALRLGVGLLTSQGWLAFFRLQAEQLWPIADQAEKMLGEQPEDELYRGEISFFRGASLMLQGDGVGALEHLDIALERIPPEFSLGLGEAEAVYGLAKFMVEGRDATDRWLEGRIRDFPPSRETRAVRLRTIAVYNQLLHGDLTRAEACRKQMPNPDPNHQNDYETAWVSYLQGLIHLHRFEMDEAADVLRPAVRLRFIHFKRAAVDSLTGTMLASQILGRPDDALNAREQFRDFLAGQVDPASLFLAGSAEARFDLLRGRPERALRWLERSPLPPAEVMLWWFEIPCVTWCRALVADGSAARLGEAEELLRQLTAMSEAHHNTLQLVGILCLLAVVCGKQGRPEEARGILERALALARPGSMVLPFLEPGPPMADLLRQFDVDGPEPGFRARLLDTFSGTASAADRAPGEVLPADVRGLLTRRELEVLTLLADGLTNQEIGSRLFVSVETIKKHLHNVYGKLEVRTRIAAIARAGALGIIRLPDGGNGGTES